MLSACPALEQDVYRPRRSHLSPYYRCIEAHFEQLEGAWEDMEKQIPIFYLLIAPGKSKFLSFEGMGFTVVPFGQGFKDMIPPTKELMKLTLEEKVAHGGHPVLRWMMVNIFIRTDPAGNIKTDKEKSSEKIDGAIATIMALGRAIRKSGTSNSVYDGRGLLVF